MEYTDDFLRAVGAHEAMKQLFGLTTSCLVLALEDDRSKPNRPLQRTLQRWLKEHRGDHLSMPVLGDALRPEQLRLANETYRSETQKLYARVQELIDAG